MARRLDAEERNARYELKAAGIPIRTRRVKTPAPKRSLGVKGGEGTLGAHAPEGMPIGHVIRVGKLIRSGPNKGKRYMDVLLSGSQQSVPSTVPDPAALAKKIIQAANDGYHNRDDFPPYALSPWNDRTKWSEYIEKVATEVLRKELGL